MADATFQLDITAAGMEILQGLALPLVKQSGEAIAARARSIAGEMSSEAIGFDTDTKVGTITNGQRAIATVAASGLNDHQAYIAHMALLKSKDAGQV